MEKIIKVRNHIEGLERRYEKEEFTLSEILQYVDSLDLLDDENIIEVIPATSKEFASGMLATVI